MPVPAHRTLSARLALAGLLLVPACAAWVASPALAAETAQASAPAPAGSDLNKTPSPSTTPSSAVAKPVPGATAAGDTRPAPAPEAASPSARAALEQLLGGAAGAEAGDMAADARTITTVRAGETLDLIIRRTLGDTPFKEGLLRAAFVEANPRLYPNGNIQRLPTGTPVQVPSAADLRRHLMRALGPERAAALAGAAKPLAPLAPAPAPAPARVVEAVAAPTASLPPAPPRPDHRGWVRFPG